MDHFNVDPLTGKLQLKKVLDFESSTTHSLVLRARDNPTAGRRSVQATITLTVSDYNEFYPVANPLLQSVTAAEDTASGVVGTITASDADGTKSLGCSLQSGSSSKFSAAFSGSTCTISLAGAIDPDLDGTPDSQTYVLNVLITDGSSSPFITTATVSVSVTGANDKSPSFGSSSYTHTVNKKLIFSWGAF